jgi:hypothetical protein
LLMMLSSARSVKLVYQFIPLKWFISFERHYSFVFLCDSWYKYQYHQSTVRVLRVGAGLTLGARGCSRIQFIVFPTRLASGPGLYLCRRCLDALGSEVIMLPTRAVHLQGR